MTAVGSPFDGPAVGCTPAPHRYWADPLPAPWAGGAPRVWVADVSAHTERAAAEEHLLDEGERARAAAFVRPVDRDRYRVAHVALRRLLAAYLGLAPAAVEFVREPCPGCGGPHGRPALPGAPLHFSLSHSGDLVLLAFADTAVGIDVEKVPSARTVTEVATTLHPAERAELAALPDAERPAAFARCWTRKEAYLKGTGTGLAEDPSITLVGAGPEPVQPPGWTLADVPLPTSRDVPVMPAERPEDLVDRHEYAAACAVRLSPTAAVAPTDPLVRTEQPPSP
ncbi:4'-phosphopantetheinyl transferase family protein [Streptomyces sp. 8N616]|uniref:4'-phosphopantetheinyl transferase family protein n=1 Tax=Streptomyces sp. 8N616 TaxID=3457414 RepID=UPI003FD2144A